MKFETTIERTGTSTAGIAVPDEVVAALGAGKRPPVTVTVNGYTYRSSIAPMGGRNLISLSSSNRVAAGLEGGETLDVEVSLDEAPRTVDVPADLAAALAAEPQAQATFDKLSYSNKSWHVLQLEAAKTPETRARRIDKSIDTLREGKPR